MGFADFREAINNYIKYNFIKCNHTKYNFIKYNQKYNFIKYKIILKNIFITSSLF